MMEITKVNIRLVEHGKNKFLGFADVEFNGLLMVRSFRILDTDQYGIIAALPSEKCKAEGKTRLTAVIRDHWLLKEIDKAVRIALNELLLSQQGLATFGRKAKPIATNPFVPKVDSYSAKYYA